MGVIMVSCNNDPEKEKSKLLDEDTPNSLVYKVTFEQDNTHAVIGESNEETMNGGSWEVVGNPKKEGRNASDKVGRSVVTQGYTRSELSSQRVPTRGYTYFYKWQYYIPNTYFTDVKVDWVLFSQWKTWPCGDHNDYGDEICGSCGIFNEISANQDHLKFEYRASPDCREANTDIKYCKWVTFVQEIYWTNSSDGYVRLYKNGELIYKEDNIKTLFDNFQEDKCDIYWAIGQYCDWSSEVKEHQSIYIDNIEIWHKHENITLQDVCPECD